MRQAPGQILALPVITALPVANEGVDMTLYQAAGKVWKYALYANLTGGTSCELWLYVRRPNDDVWYLAATTGTLGKLGGGLLTPGQYVFTVNDIGIFDEVVVRKMNDTGGVTVVCSLQEYIENNFTRGD